MKILKLAQRYFTCDKFELEELDNYLEELKCRGSFFSEKEAERKMPNRLTYNDRLKFYIVKVTTTVEVITYTNDSRHEDNFDQDDSESAI